MRAVTVGSAGGVTELWRLLVYGPITLVLLTSLGVLAAGVRPGRACSNGSCALHELCVQLHGLAPGQIMAAVMNERSIDCVCTQYAIGRATPASFHTSVCSWSSSFVGCQ